MILIRKETPTDRQDIIDKTLYTIQVTGAQLRRMARLSYTKEGGDEFPHDPDRIYNWVQEVEPAIDGREPLVAGKRI